MLKEEADILGRLLNAKGQPQGSIRCGLELVVKVVGQATKLVLPDARAEAIAADDGEVTGCIVVGRVGRQSLRDYKGQPRTRLDGSIGPRTGWDDVDTRARRETGQDSTERRLCLAPLARRGPVEGFLATLCALLMAGWSTPEPGPFGQGALQLDKTCLR
jgi:hypothetical protein